MSERRTIAQLLEAARARLGRVDPQGAAERQSKGALLIDIRPFEQRVAQGEIPGALVIERNVLEWRLDPASDARIPYASYDLDVVIFCAEGYTSSLAAAAAQDLGIWKATDLAGGFSAWREAGRNVVRGGTPAGQWSPLA